MKNTIYDTIYDDVDDLKTDKEYLHEYILLRKIISTKLSVLVTLNIISRERAENIYDSILFNIIDIGYGLKETDITLAIIDYLIHHPLYYCEHNKNEAYKKIYTAILSQALGVPTYTLNMTYNITNSDYLEIIKFVIDNNILAPTEGWDNDLCLY